MGLGGGDGRLCFDGFGLATEGELEGMSDLFSRVIAGFFDDTIGKSDGLVVHEGAVKEVKCLDCSGGLFAARCGLAGIGSVEGTEDGYGFHADLVLVDHAAEFFLGKVSHRRETAEAAAGFKETEARSTGLEIQVAAHKENAVANGFGFEPARGESPK